ncbi:MAG: ParM/StbA family protein [Oscillibacter sp.]|nr:ParM/StbA family protein [Oscillibacter sp.]
MSKTLYISIDHGYYNVKTVHCCFPAGVLPQYHKPYSLKDVLEYDGRYYLIGGGRQPIQEDKTETEDYYLMTLAAIAKEIEYQNADRVTRVYLGAGLPLTSVNRDKELFQDYLVRDRQSVMFRFEGQSYVITVVGATVFPQGFAGAVLRDEYLKEPSILVTDIGGWTVDVLRMDNNRPDVESFHSKPYGVICCLDTITESVRGTLGLNLTPAQIESFMRSGVSTLDDLTLQLINEEARKYTRRILAIIREGGFDIRAMPVIFMGGGAVLIQRYLPPCGKRLRYMVMEDIKLNALGYEFLLNRMRAGSESG